MCLRKILPYMIVTVAFGIHFSENNAAAQSAGPEETPGFENPTPTPQPTDAPEPTATPQYTPSSEETPWLEPDETPEAQGSPFVKHYFGKTYTKGAPTKGSGCTSEYATADSCRDNRFPKLHAVDHCKEGDAKILVDSYSTLQVCAAAAPTREIDCDDVCKKSGQGGGSCATAAIANCGEAGNVKDVAGCMCARMKRQEEMDDPALGEGEMIEDWLDSEIPEPE